MPAIAGALATGVLVGILSALAGVGGGVLMVPFLYLVYRSAPVNISAQTVVAHATSLGVAFVTSTIGTWRFARIKAIAWKAAGAYAVPGIVSAFVTARILAHMNGSHWVRVAFGAFLLISALDMARRSRRSRPESHAHPSHSPGWLALAGFFGGAMASLLGIGGGLVAVPVLLYVGRLPVQAVAPTALAGVCLTTLSGGIGYATAGQGPPVSSLMVGFIDLRMALPLALGAVCSVPFGVRLQRRSSPATLYWLFAAVFGVMGILLIKEGFGG